MGQLYIVSTPIGNLEDTSFRSLRILTEVDIILCEDTRTTTNLLKHFNLPQKELVSYFEGNEERKLPEVVQWLVQGKNIALVSESGTPLISDPGYKLIRAVISQGFPIISIPGPTALIAALTVAGLPTNNFLYLGFLPKKKQKLKKVLENLKALGKNPLEIKTVIFYESPHRILQSLKLLLEVWGSIEIVVCRELTKIHEEVKRGNIEEIIADFSKEGPRGELVILLALSK